jgi:hypothetical protein
VFGDTHADRIEGGKNARVTAGRFTIEAQSIVARDHTATEYLALDQRGAQSAPVGSAAPE